MCVAHLQLARRILNAAREFSSGEKDACSHGLNLRIYSSQRRGRRRGSRLYRQRRGSGGGDGERSGDASSCRARRLEQRGTPRGRRCGRAGAESCSHAQQRAATADSVAQHQHRQSACVCRRGRRLDDDFRRRTRARSFATAQVRMQTVSHRWPVSSLFCTTRHMATRPCPSPCRAIPRASASLRRPAPTGGGPTRRQLAALGSLWPFGGAAARAADGGAAAGASGPTGEVLSTVAGIRQKRLGGGDVVVSELGLGTQRWGGADKNSPQEALCFRLLDRATEAGVSLVDTAEQYPIPSDRARPEGSTEAILGRWLAQGAPLCRKLRLG